jgi:hypothetical protein
MNFTSKLALTLTAAAATLCPIAAYAGPSTGSTAAAVSIKFNDCKCGTASGNFSIVPGGNANGAGTGVKELSAAVATGETSATASSASKHHGTTATANGFSQPVTFKYVTTENTSDSIIAREYASSNQSQYNQESKSASGEKQSSYETANAANSTSGSASNGTKGKGTSSNVTANLASGVGSGGVGNSSTSSGGKHSSSYSTSSNTGSGSASSTEGRSGDKSGSQSGNSQNGSSSSVNEKTGNVLNTANSGTSYEYTGTSAGLSFIPVIK